MATGFKKPCKFPGVICRNLAEPGQRYCPQHMEEYERQERERHREYKANRVDYDEQSFYNSSLWKKLRAQKLQDNPVCEICNRAAACMVDHITPIKEGGARSDLSNLQSSCWSCHNRKTASERKK